MVFFLTKFEIFTAKVFFKTKNKKNLTEHYPCRVCSLEVEDDDKSVQCDLCDRWIHIKCAEINHQKYEKLKKDPIAWYCVDCTTELPFSTFSNKDFKDFLYSKTTPEALQILQKSSKEIKKMMFHFEQVNQLFDQSENSIGCDYYDIDDFNKVVINKIDLTVIMTDLSCSLA